jgi:hypothetical protein
LNFEDSAEKPELLAMEFCALITRETTGNTDIFPRKTLRFRCHDNVKLKPIRL